MQNPSKLNEKQKLFVAHYISCRNGAEAARKAGYEPKNADVSAQRMLRIPAVRAEVDRQLQKAVEAAGFDCKRVLEEIGRLATVDITQAFNADGSLKLLTEMDEDLRRSISSLEVNEIYDNASGDQKHVLGLAKRVKFYDKVKALELAGKYFKMFTDRVEHSMKVPVTVIYEVIPGKSDKSQNIDYIPSDKELTKES
jgi:phage terminase small subunit